MTDPAATYRAMLAAGPVVWLARNGLHAVVGHDALCQVLRDHRRFRSGRGVAIDEEVNARLIGSTLNSDPPEHDEGRALTAAPLTPKGLRAVTDRIEAEAEALAARLVAQRRFDAAAELAPHLPLTIVRDLVGLPDDARDRMLDWAAATFELMGDPRERRDRATANQLEMRAWMGRHSAPESLAPGGWARRIFELGPGAGIPPGRCAELMRDYINPSLDTTIAAIGYGVRLFAEHPDQWDRLRAEPELMKNAIEEIVRLNTPIRGFSRYVAEDAELAGVPLTRGSRVLVVWGAGNRDPARFPDPDRFDITRNTRGHLGFGHGVHACMGMHLARAEMAALFGALARRVARFRMTGPALPVTNATICAYRTVPVEIDPL